MHDEICIKLYYDQMHEKKKVMVQDPLCQNMNLTKLSLSIKPSLSLPTYLPRFLA